MGRYLITGGAGFIGTNLAESLVARGRDVVVVDDLTGGTDPSRLPKEVEFKKLDIRETDALAKAMQDTEVVFHLAALPRVQFSIEHPQESHDVNVNGTLSVLVSAKKAGVGRVVYAASSSAYGDQETLPLSENLPAQPKSPYALQKYVGEGLMRLWSEIYEVPTVSLRFFNVYGKHMDPDGAYALVVGRFLKLRKEGKKLTIYGDGEQTRDFTHVSDIIDALIRASESDKVGNGEVINTGAGRDISVNELAKLAGGEVEYLPPRVEPKYTRADIRRAKELLGWEPKIRIEDGMARLKEEWGLV